MTSNAELIAWAKQGAFDYARIGHKGMAGKMSEVAAALESAENERVKRAWDEGYEAGEADEAFNARGMSTDPDAAEHPHANPYRANPAQE